MSEALLELGGRLQFGADGVQDVLRGVERAGVGSKIPELGKTTITGKYLPFVGENENPFHRGFTDRFQKRAAEAHFFFDFFDAQYIAGRSDAGADHRASLRRGDSDAQRVRSEAEGPAASKARIDLRIADLLESPAYPAQPMQHPHDRCKTPVAKQLLCGQVADTGNAGTVHGTTANTSTPAAPPAPGHIPYPRQRISGMRIAE